MRARFIKGYALDMYRAPDIFRYGWGNLLPATQKSCTTLSLREYKQLPLPFQSAFDFKSWGLESSFSLSGMNVPQGLASKGPHSDPSIICQCCKRPISPTVESPCYQTRLTPISGDMDQWRACLWTRQALQLTVSVGDQFQVPPPKSWKIRILANNTLIVNAIHNIVLDPSSGQ